MFHIADCQSSWPQCGRRKRKRLRESERREEKEEENIGEGGIGSLSWPTTRSPEPNKRTIVSSLAAKAHDLLVARDRGRAGGREWQVCGNFLATATAASDNRNAYKHEISAMSAHPTCLLTRQNHSYPWPAEQRGSSRGAAEGQQRNSSGAALAPHVVWYSHSLLPDQTGSPCWLNTSLGRHVLLHDRALGKWTGPQLGVYGAQGPPLIKGCAVDRQ